jgi:DNA repair protein RadC
MQQIANPKDVFFLTKEIHNQSFESLIIFYLNKIGNIAEKKTIKTNGHEIKFNQAQIFSPTLNNKAKFIILCHNHPSGKFEPSHDDIKTTKKIIKAGKILGIPLIDHVIVTQNGYYSIMLKSKALLPFDHQTHQSL